MPWVLICLLVFQTHFYLKAAPTGAAQELPFPTSADPKMVPLKREAHLSQFENLPLIITTIKKSPRWELVKQRKISQTQIAVLDAPEGHPHSQGVLKHFDRLLSKKVLVRLYPIFPESGELDPKYFAKALHTAIKDGNTILNLSWNIASSEKTKMIEKALNQITQAHPNIILVASAGENTQDRHKILPLSQTVLGKVPRAFLIGEMAESGFLAPRSFWGPEMFMILRPQDSQKGSTFSAVEFSSALALLFLEEREVP